MKLGYIETEALVPSWSLAFEKCVALLVDYWERSAASRTDAVRLPGPPLLTVEDYYPPPGWVVTDQKLVVIQGPAELLGRGVGEELQG